MALSADQSLNRKRQQQKIRLAGSWLSQWNSIVPVAGLVKPNFRAFSTVALTMSPQSAVQCSAVRFSWFTVVTIPKPQCQDRQRTLPWQDDDFSLLLVVCLITACVRSTVNRAQRDWNCKYGVCSADITYSLFKDGPACVSLLWQKITVRVEIRQIDKTRKNSVCNTLRRQRLLRCDCNQTEKDAQTIFGRLEIFVCHFFFLTLENVEQPKISQGTTVQPLSIRHFPTQSPKECILGLKIQKHTCIVLLVSTTSHTHTAHNSTS